MTGKVARRDGVWMAYPPEWPADSITPYASELKALRNAMQGNRKIVFVPYGVDLIDAINGHVDHESHGNSEVSTTVKGEMTDE